MEEGQTQAVCFLCNKKGHFSRNCPKPAVDACISALRSNAFRKIVLEVVREALEPQQAILQKMLGEVSHVRNASSLTLAEFDIVKRAFNVTGIVVQRVDGSSGPADVIADFQALPVAARFWQEGRTEHSHRHLYAAEIARWGSRPNYRWMDANAYAFQCPASDRLSFPLSCKNDEVYAPNSVNVSLRITAGIALGIELKISVDAAAFRQAIVELLVFSDGNPGFLQMLVDMERGGLVLKKHRGIIYVTYLDSMGAVQQFVRSFIAGL